MTPAILIFKNITDRTKEINNHRGTINAPKATFTEATKCLSVVNFFSIKVNNPIAGRLGI